MVFTNNAQGETTFAYKNLINMYKKLDIEVDKLMGIQFIRELNHLSTGM